MLATTAWKPTGSFAELDIQLNSLIDTYLSTDIEHPGRINALKRYFTHVNTVHMASISLPATQYKLLSAVVDAQSVEIDWNAVAETAGIETSKKARENWPTIKKKFEGSIGEETTITIELTEAQKTLLNAIDFSAAAKGAGLNTAKKARENWKTIKNKLHATAAGEKKTKKRKADEPADQDDGETAEPVKKAKAAAEKESTKKAVPKSAAAKKGKKGKKAGTASEEPGDADQEAPEVRPVGYQSDHENVQPEQEGQSPSIFNAGR
ncbi:hypothetical protein LTR53_006364 [Teratosphaeriaceae sp. CCFEE 6253]|nr:hypothetical protein LTR53_006364 [Teratosphaeriaceae sp. CCFEE 6253]